MPDLIIPSTPPLAEFFSAESGMRVVEELYTAEEPIVFVSSNSIGQRLLALNCGCQDDSLITLLSPISPGILSKLKIGAISVLDALTSSWLYLCVDSDEGLRVWPIDIESVPPDFLPVAGTPLLPEHEAVLVTKAVGQGVRIGHVPASVIGYVADATKGAIKILLDAVTDARGEGRPRANYRSQYDLPVQRIQFASFEVSFCRPDNGLFENEDLARSILLLKKGIKWASSDQVEADFGDDNPYRQPILKAALCLTPPSGSPVDYIAVSGTWINESVKLTVESRTKINRMLKSIQTESVFKIEGRIENLDTGRGTFILRDTDDGIDKRGQYSPDIYDDMYAYLNGARVEMVGIDSGGLLTATGVAPVRSTSN